MAPPINVQDWYGDRHTCQIASGALAISYPFLFRDTPQNQLRVWGALRTLRVSPGEA